MFEQESTSDPRVHAANIKAMLNDVIEHARADVEKVSDPGAQALFETTAETLIGLRKAYEDFEQENERAWKQAG